MPIGPPCCADEDESLSKVAVPIVNWLVHTGWESASSNRWTKTVVALRRVMAGFLAQRVLPESLRAMQASWGLDDALIPQLERLIAADMNDFQSRTRLMPIRVCKGFCPRALLMS